MLRLNYKLSELSQNELNLYHKIIDSFRDLYKPYLEIFFETPRKYNKQGLRYSIEHLKAVRPFIIFFPIEKMANYVDEICKYNVDNGIKIDPDDFFKTVINTTSYGNIAYMIINATSINEQVVYRDYLDYMINIDILGMNITIPDEIKETLQAQINKRENEA